MVSNTGTPRPRLVQRLPSTTNEPSTCSGLIFTPDELSDELFEELKMAYPNIKQHVQRKLQAVIDFLLDELHDIQRQERQSGGSASSNRGSHSSSPTGTVDSHNPSRRSRSRDTPLDYPDSDESSGREVPHIGSIHVNSGRTINPSLPSPPTTGQNFVFNAVDGRYVQPKTRKKMNAEEKAQYKETRRRGACESCRRAKGKCTHKNDPTYQLSEMLSPKQSTGKRKHSSLDLGRMGPNKTPKTEEETNPLSTTTMANVTGSRVTTGLPDPSQCLRSESDGYLSNEQSGQMKGSEIPSPPASLPSPPVSCTSASSDRATPAAMPPPPPPTTTSVVSIHTAQS